jgi:pteridine reductase
MPAARSARVALVTGSGAPRIGNLVARSLAARGYDVVLNAHRSLANAQATADELKQSGRDALVVKADVANEADVRRMVEESLAHFGRLDALVNCAAIWERKSLEQVAAKDVRRHFEVNVLGTFLCCQIVGLRMVEQPEGGAIVNFGDWAIARPYRSLEGSDPSPDAVDGRRAWAAQPARARERGASRSGHAAGADGKKGARGGDRQHSGSP